MAVLQSSEYDARYFEGGSQDYTHNAGYTSYRRVQYNQVSAQYVGSLEESTGTIYGDICKGLNIKLNNRFVGKKLLVLGCAYGFEVQSFRQLGIDAYGVDVSSFAISQAETSVQPYLEVADIRTKVLTYSRNQWDYIFSRWFLECMSDADLTALIPELNRVCKSNQVHIINPSLREDYYNSKTIEDWIQMPFANGTIFVVNNDFENYIIK